MYFQLLGMGSVQSFEPHARVVYSAHNHVTGKKLNISPEPLCIAKNDCFDIIYLSRLFTKLSKAFRNEGRIVHSSVKLTRDFSVRFLIYIVRPSVLSLNNLNLHRTYLVKNIFTQEKSMLRLTFNLVLALTGHSTARHRLVVSQED